MRLLRRLLFAITALVLLGWLWASLSPWPGALLVRATFKQGGEAMRAGLVPYEVPGVRVLADIAYLPHDPDAVLDVYLPPAATGQARLPVVVWTHGGGWIGGDKSELRGYLMQLAQQGHVVVALNYSLAPEHHFPRALQQVSAALEHIGANAARYHADMQRVFLAGDSAGAQLTAQTAALITNPAHAEAVGVAPPLRPHQLRGLVLHCGLYDLRTYVQRAELAGGFVGYGARILPWAYLGERTPTAEALRTISPLVHATAAFPPVFISGGNGDPLTAHQSRPMAARLRQLGVPVHALFFPDHHQPALPHEYQFALGTAAADSALRMTLDFLRQYTADATTGAPTP